MLSKKIEKALVKQINAELYASYLYFAMASDLEAKGYAGTSNWMKAQAQEEIGHAMRIYNYVNERGGKAEMKQIDEPKNEWKNLQEVFEDSLEHEKKITKMINDLMDLAIEEKDHATKSFLNWYVDEQVEEEDSMNEVLDKLEMVKNSKNGLYNIDKELGGRQKKCEFVSEEEE